MTENHSLIFSSLNEQVIRYRSRQMSKGGLQPGSTTLISEKANQPDISRTPLRAALVQLEIEGFVTIIPRRKAKLNALSADATGNAYDTVGLVESSIVTKYMDKITNEHIRQLKRLNRKKIQNIKKRQLCQTLQ